MDINLVADAIAEAGGVTRVARECSITHQAVRRWRDNGRLPRTDITGETRYAAILARMTRGQYKRKDLLNQTRQVLTRRWAA